MYNRRLDYLCGAVIVKRKLLDEPRRLSEVAGRHHLAEVPSDTGGGWCRC